MRPRIWRWLDRLPHREPVLLMAAGQILVGALVAYRMHSESVWFYAMVMDGVTVAMAINARRMVWSRATLERLAQEAPLDSKILFPYLD